MVLSDAAGQVAASQVAIEETRVPVHHLKADAAAGLLPNFLPEYMRVDAQNNALLVSGPKSLSEKVAADLAKIDRPPIAVSVRARVIETSVSEDATRALALQFARAGRQLAADAGGAEISYATSDDLPDDFEATLRALVGAGRATVRADSSIVVESGESGEIFAGQDKYVVVFRRLYDAEPSVEPVHAGVSLKVTPNASEQSISMAVTAEVRTIGAVDPGTGMPVVDTRSTSGVFRVRPGETVVIGGLSQEQEYWTRRRLPILGHLPLVGGLFCWKERQHMAAELIVLLTPGLADAESRGPLSGATGSEGADEPIEDGKGGATSSGSAIVRPVWRGT
jgi:type II secretory pathway component GspD/PulD (secretin)